jgi:2-polyprenyl-6-methoxyphenol hydroxylase-like FAD-dependent oxidoreductase
VTGLRTGEWERAADVVVDACGRRSSVDRWLEEIGAWPAERRSADCGVTYFGRHYRFISGSSLPGPPTTRIVVGFAEFTAVLFCSDNGAVQTALIPLTADRRFRHLGEPGVYDAVMGLVPTHAPWMGTLEPISPVHQMVAPHNTLRRLVIEGEPVVTGLLPVGDSVCTTNPTFGRGLSLAAWGASDLVEVLAESPDDQVAQALSLDARIAEHVVPYYEDQAKVDEGRLVMLRSAVFGTSVPEPPPGGPQVTFARLRYASAVNPVAFRGFWSLMGMLKPPNEVYGDPAVIDAVERASADGFPDDPAPDASLLAAALQR